MTPAILVIRPGTGPAQGYETWRLFVQNDKIVHFDDLEMAEKECSSLNEKEKTKRHPNNTVWVYSVVDADVIRVAMKDR